ncbi:MAG: dihydroorotase [Lachnospiraceae bacterium]|jgi:dihydroorotase|nr:dihydroorotase [Lachnospiraceae bacterium]MEE3461317.1 dihydroorotase [Lachnospiraceae bacterium]
MNLLIKNARLIDPANDTDRNLDIYVEDGKVAQVKEKLELRSMFGFVEEDGEGLYQVAASANDPVHDQVRVIDASGLIAMPGFVDLHVHLREPGFEYKETIKTGAMAAAHGGVTTICPMPNTKPVIDSKEAVLDELKRAEEAVVNVCPIGAVTVGQEGKEIADLSGMKEAGIVALSEDGKSVMDTGLYMQALRKAGELGLPVFSHCEDRSLVNGGVMNLGAKSEELGLPGIDNASEDIIEARDIIMAHEAGVHMHLCHCSTKLSVDIVKWAKSLGFDVSAEVTPHHFTMTDDEITEDHGRFKMNPPLRSHTDKEALIYGLKENIMDTISTDHAPHGAEEKDQSMLKAPFGITGLETSFALAYTELVKNGPMSLSDLVTRMSVTPSALIGINKGNLKVGKCADIVLADIDHEYEIDPDTFLSKGKNTPFAGKKVFGRVMYTIVGGRVVYEG